MKRSWSVVLLCLYFVLAMWFTNSVDIFRARALMDCWERASVERAYDEDVGEYTPQPMGTYLLWFAQWYLACLPGTWVISRREIKDRDGNRVGALLLQNLLFAFVFFVFGALVTMFLLAGLELIGLKSLVAFFERYILRPH